MLIRSGKIQFLFWTAFFSVMIYLWIVAIGVQTFVLPDEKPMELPQNAVVLMFILYGLLIISVLAGTIVAAMIDNKFYRNFFGTLLIIAFVTVLAAKSMFG
ncbi:hypothetical protein [Sulfurovum riftiae]|uniref:Uncharacterized protein n=1 Tax=Sulfurovum riftiae TaxID=1630136 RepID=A0A151CHV9_9BACT|nr:hypothetical protein [Sulfurovum riftiae]KYJ87024.1 hypothetical protein AS592_03570 [Sulfurovum riftiae]